MGRGTQPEEDAQLELPAVLAEAQELVTATRTGKLAFPLRLELEFLDETHHERVLVLPASLLDPEASLKDLIVVNHEVQMGWQSCTGRIRVGDTQCTACPKATVQFPCAHLATAQALAHSSWTYDLDMLASALDGAITHQARSILLVETPKHEPVFAVGRVSDERAGFGLASRTSLGGSITGHVVRDTECSRCLKPSCLLVSWVFATLDTMHSAVTTLREELALDPEDEITPEPSGAYLHAVETDVVVKTQWKWDTLLGHGHEVELSAEGLTFLREVVSSVGVCPICETDRPCDHDRLWGNR